MTRRRHWFHDLKLLRRRLAGFNQQGKRYRHPPVSWDEFILGLRQARPQLLERCVYCDRPLTKQNVSFDHRIPLARGGPHCLENMGFIDKTCNLLKSAWSPEFWDSWVKLLRSQVNQETGEDWFTIFRKNFCRTRWTRK